MNISSVSIFLLSSQKKRKLLFLYLDFKTCFNYTHPNKYMNLHLEASDNSIEWSVCLHMLKAGAPSMLPAPFILPLPIVISCCPPRTIFLIVSATSHRWTCCHLTLTSLLHLSFTRPLGRLPPSAWMAGGRKVGERVRVVVGRRMEDAVGGER